MEAGTDGNQPTLEGLKGQFTHCVFWLFKILR